MYKCRIYIKIYNLDHMCLCSLARGPNSVESALDGCFFMYSSKAGSYVYLDRSNGFIYVKPELTNKQMFLRWFQECCKSTSNTPQIQYTSSKSSLTSIKLAIFFYYFLTKFSQNTQNYSFFKLSCEAAKWFQSCSSAIITSVHCYFTNQCLVTFMMEF